jgi:hypothetical protein
MRSILLGSDLQNAVCFHFSSILSHLVLTPESLCPRLVQLLIEQPDAL